MKKSDLREYVNKKQAHALTRIRKPYNEHRIKMHEFYLAELKNTYAGLFKALEDFKEPYAEMIDALQVTFYNASNLRVYAKPKTLETILCDLVNEGLDAVERGGSTPTSLQYMEEEAADHLAFLYRKTAKDYSSVVDVTKKMQNIIGAAKSAKQAFTDLQTAGLDMSDFEQEAKHEVLVIKVEGADILNGGASE